MNVASLEPCKELYELSGWHPGNSPNQTGWYEAREGTQAVTATYREEMQMTGWKLAAPAYPLGYLLRKLREGSADSSGSLWFWIELRARNGRGDLWHCDAVFEQSDGYSLGADTPEDAAAKLAIELFKQGILIKGE